MIQGLIVYTAAEFKGAAGLLADSHFGRRLEHSAPWTSVNDLRTNKDWRLTLLGHADGEKFGGLSAAQLVNGLLDRHFRESSHQILELIGCAAAAAPSREIVTYVDQVRGLLHAVKIAKPLSVRGLRQPATGEDSDFFTFGNGQFVYVNGNVKDIEAATTKFNVLSAMVKARWSDSDEAFEKFIEWLREKNIHYETDEFANIRQYLSEPERRVTHKGGVDHPLLELLIPHYEK